MRLVICHWSFVIRVVQFTVFIRYNSLDEGPAIVFQIFQWRKTGYVPAPKRGGWQRSAVFGRDFRLVREPARMGLWEYTLHMRPE